MYTFILFAAVGVAWALFQVLAGLPREKIGG